MQLGLATSAGGVTTTYADAAYVTVTFVDLPDYQSNYYPSSGSFSFTANGTTIAATYDSMYAAYTTTFPDPGSIASQSVTMNIPLTPTPVAGGASMGNSIVGVTINGSAFTVVWAARPIIIFAEAGSFDQCQGHPAGSVYHYHSERTQSLTKITP